MNVSRMRVRALGQCGKTPSRAHVCSFNRSCYSNTSNYSRGYYSVTLQAQAVCCARTASARRSILTTSDEDAHHSNTPLSRYRRQTNLPPLPCVRPSRCNRAASTSFKPRTGSAATETPFCGQTHWRNAATVTAVLWRRLAS